MILFDLFLSTSSEIWSQTSAIIFKSRLPTGISSQMQMQCPIKSTPNFRHKRLL
jgi:hypothetical protein